MRITLSVIKADIGSIGGHIAPSQRLLETVRSHVRRQGAGLLLDSYVSHTGDDIAVLSAHTHGVGDVDVGQGASVLHGFLLEAGRAHTLAGPPGRALVAPPPSG